MKKRFLFWLPLIAFPFLLMGLVNAFSPAPETGYYPDRCTRSCHNQRCPHFDTQQHSTIHKVYNWHIKALQNNGLGLSYTEANILIYVLLFPILMAGLLWFALPNFRRNE